ncbi:MAG: amino acid adenylation domain-containing protein, partial [Acidimicrobiia bacterium]
MRQALQNVDDVYPLTATQEGMLYHTLSDPDSGVYVNQIITPMSGELDVARLEQAWGEVVARHETLRTAFLWDGLDDPLQVVRSESDTEWSHLDLDGLASSEQDRRLEVFLGDDRRRGFDLAQAPLCRMALVRLGPAEWKWIWSFHHLIVDGWSAHLILDELLGRYGFEGPGDVELARPPKYRDFVAGYLARDESREEAFWTERLAGFTEPHRLEVPGLPPEADASGYATYSLDLGAPASEALAAAARELNVTLNTVFLGAWTLLLSRWTRSSDVVFGTTVAGRPSSLPGVEHAAGLFINTLPQRVEARPHEPLGEWLRGIQRGQIETRDYEQSSLASIQRWSDVEGGEALFDSILVFENYPRREQSNRFGGIEIGERTYLEQSNYPLAVLVLPGDSIRVLFVYDTATFSGPAIESLGSQVGALLTSMASRPTERLASYGLTDEKADAWLRTAGAGPDSTGDATTIHELIRRVAETTPEATALVDPAGSTSYRDLLVRAEAIAARLAKAGIGPNRLVGLHLPRSADMITGLLGILEAGGAYVPLDPAYPAAHLQDLLADDGIEFVLTSSALAPDVPEHVTTILIDVDDPSDDPAIRLPATESDLAYVIHTSGSTGRPKGVAVTHENLVRSTAARSVHYEGPVGSFLLLSSFAFDSSVAGIFWTLTTGGTLVLPAPDQERDVISLLALANEQRVTHTLCLPSLYEVLLEHAGSGQLDSLRVAIVAGEACPARVLEAHRQRLPDTALHNEYGPTEGTVWCTAHRATGADEILPIGRPIAGSRIFLLDEHGNPVPPGFAGEICLAGSGVVPGYLGRPDLTAERFVSIPVLGVEERIYRTGDLGAWRSDGVLTYLGRSDTQLKVRGHRIEATAVETALRSNPAISEAVALGWSAAGRPAAQLVAYVGTDGVELDIEDVKGTLSATLPEFMVPDIVVSLPGIPRLPNGKVNVGSLPDPHDHARRVGEHVAPRTEREAVLASIWSDLLGVDVVGVRDDFFELGGDSIVSIRMISRARQAGIHVAPGQIAGHPTIEQLATATSGEAVLQDEPVSGPVPIGPIQQWFFEMNHAVPDQWNQSSLFAVEAGVDAGVLERALRACVAHHDMLRSRFVHRNGTWEQHV